MRLESATASIDSAGPGLSPDTGQTDHRAPLGATRALGRRQNSCRSNTSGREASDATPIMGSSFSDLDGMSPDPEDSGFLLIDCQDANVTQSALDEALLSNMQHGGMASRMAEHKIQSSYLPAHMQGGDAIYRARTRKSLQIARNWLLSILLKFCQKGL
jgi:hypothetical protein